MTNKEIILYPDWVCKDCAISAGGRLRYDLISCYHDGKCGICKEDKSVIQPRDYGYPYFKREKDLK
jgi:hypothetical protein